MYLFAIFTRLGWRDHGYRARLRHALPTDGLLIRIRPGYICLISCEIYDEFSIPTDVDLIADGKHFPVNHIYLSACSPVFAAMFQTNIKERDSSEIEIKEVASAEHFADFLRLLPQNSLLPNRKLIMLIQQHN